MEMDDIGLELSVQFPKVIQSAQIIDGRYIPLQVPAMYALHLFIKHMPHLSVTFTRSDNDFMLVTD
jgi:hypothetical protein